MLIMRSDRKRVLEFLKLTTEQIDALGSSALIDYANAFWNIHHALSKHAHLFAKATKEEIDALLPPEDNKCS